MVPPAPYSVGMGVDPVEVYSLPSPNLILETVAEMALSVDIFASP